MALSKSDKTFILVISLAALVLFTITSIDNCNTKKAGAADNTPSQQESTQ